VDKIRILYFLEDRAQEGFIKAFVGRIAKEESIPDDSIVHDVRSARGGSRAISEFRKFINDMAEVEATEVDSVVVAIDGNCKGYTERIRELDKPIKENHPFKGRVIYAIPDPHIERWYLMDQRALKASVGLDRAPDLPPYKCKRDYYKGVLSRALKEADVGSLLGGAEYAEIIVGNISDLYWLGKQDAGFGAFVENLRKFFKEVGGKRM